MLRPFGTENDATRELYKPASSEIRLQFQCRMKLPIPDTFSIILNRKPRSEIESNRMISACLFSIESIFHLNLITPNVSFLSQYMYMHICTDYSAHPCTNTSLKKKKKKLFKQ